jgi:preflagellin peptidase FlaK
MVIELISVFIALLACLYASYSDITRGIIPNRLTFPVIGLGLLLNGIRAFMESDPWIFIYTAIFTAGIFALGYILWRMGAWAGGDVKLFTAVTALIPFQPSLVSYSFLGVALPVTASYPFPLTVIINSILALLPFLLVYVFFIIYTSRRDLMDEFMEPLRQYRTSMVLALVITSAVTLTFIITDFLPFQIIVLSLILVYLLTMVISRLPSRVKAVMVSAILVYSLYRNFELTVSGVVILWVSITVIQLIRKLLTSITREALQDTVSVDELKEGMILASTLYRRGDEYYFDDTSLLDRFRTVARTGDVSALTYRGEPVVSAMAAGLRGEEIETLRELVAQGKIRDEFRIRRGMPFAPAILIGLVVSLLIGDLAVILFRLFDMIF